MTVPPAVVTLWWTGLVVTLVVFVPLAVYLLHRTWQAARSIQRYAAEARQAVDGIVAHTAQARALEATIEVATETVNLAGSVAGKLDTVATVLAGRAR